MKNQRQKRNLAGRWQWAMAGVVVLFVAGCMSPQKRFDKGAAAELRGDYPQAIAQYAKVLKAEPTWPGAAERLTASGAAYWQSARAQIESARQVRDMPTVAERYLDASRVMAPFSGTGVSSPLPAGFHQSLATACREGSNQLLTDAKGRVAVQDWTNAESLLRRATPLAKQSGDSNALKETWGDLYLGKAEVAIAANRASEAADLLRRAKENIRPGSAAARKLLALQGELADAQIRETVVKIRKEFNAKRYRRAYELAAEAEAQLPRGDSRAQQLAQIRREAVTAGSRSVAYVPYWLTKATVPSVPTGWLDALSADAERKHWRQSGTPFIVSQPQNRVSDAMRTLRYDRRNLSAEHLTILGQRMPSDLVVYGELTGYSVNRGAVSEEQVAGKLGSGKPATWTRRAGSFEYVATLTIQVVDVQRARAILQIPVTATVPGNMRSGHFNGDYTELVLSAEDRRCFDRTDRENEKRRVEDALLLQLNEKAAVQVRTAILKQIP